MRALSIRQPWAWLIAAGYKDIENRTWDTKFRGQFLVHAGQQFDQTGFAWVRANFPLIPMPEQFSLGGFVGVAEIKACHKYSRATEHIIRSPWFNGPFGFELTNTAPLRFIPFPGRLGFFKPLGDYSVRPCRGHWHVTVGKEADDLALAGDPYSSMYDALVSAFAHKAEMDSDREDFRKSQIVSGEASRRELGKLLRRARTYGDGS